MRRPDVGREAAGMGGPGATAGEDRELPRVVPFQGDLIEYFLPHLRIHEAAHAEGGLKHVDAERNGNFLLDRLPGASVSSSISPPR